MLSDSYTALDLNVPVSIADVLVVELIFADPAGANDIANRINKALPQANATVEAMFEDDSDRFHFVTFPMITGDGQEALAFEFAHDLRRETDASEANPLLTDGLYGAGAFDAADIESFAGFCETPRDDTLPWGGVHPVIKATGAWTTSRDQGTTLATWLTAGTTALWVAKNGGHAALLQRARVAGTTVQAIFVHCATQGLDPPDTWGGASNFGAGLLDADNLLEADFPTGIEARTSETLDGIGVVSSLSILQTHLASRDPDSLGDIDGGMADYASEVIWLSQKAVARARVAELETAEVSALPTDIASPGLAARLADKPALRTALRQP